MSEKLPEQAQVVIVGGGVIGCSVAYHLTQAGWTDVVLLERKSLTSGTTWHAAGLIGQLRATLNMTRLAQYTTEVLLSLEEETGQATGYKQNGALVVTADHERLIELKRSASIGQCFGLDVQVVSPEEAGALWPLLNTDDLVGGVFIPSEGQTNPVDTTLAYAKGARMRGARIFENTKVTAIHQSAGKVTGVATEDGDVRAEFVVNCGGMWGREVGRMAGVNIPLHAAEHFYVLTEPIEGLSTDLPSLRDQNGCLYVKEDAGKLLLGAFEKEAKPWGMDGIPEDFSFDQLPDDWDHFEPILEFALHRIPALAETGIQTFFCGPESFTPDDRYLLGEAPELRNFYVACGFNSIGIGSSGGAGKMLSEWIINGYPSMDLWEVDVRRMLPFQGNARYLEERVVEGLGLLYDMHWPFRQYETARGIRKSPLHDRLASRGACFGEAVGWERPNWYAPDGVEPRYAYSYGRQNWFEHSAAEHRAVRERVGLIDQSSFGKILVSGADAEAVLNNVCANDVAVAADRVVYTQWLNERGGIEADLTVTRLAEDRYLVVTGVECQVRDVNWLTRNMPADSRTVVTDVTSAYAVLSVMGPQSRDLLARVTNADLSHEAFPFATSREIDLGYTKVRATRITYVGELGWELYVPVEFTASVFDALTAHGEDFGLTPVGFHAVNSLRMEKGYRHWGHDISDEDTPVEAGLGFAVALGKNAGFIGRDAVVRQKEGGVTKRLVTFVLEDPEPLVYHYEPIRRDGDIIGYLTSGMFGHTVGAAIGMGYVNNSGGVTKDWIEAGSYDIDIAGERFAARATLAPLYDPKRERILT
ncbi:MAG: FAD-dependent oxidoreductase [Alphaproteobacteria bacterium]|nr:FAD-dependent oxidoreductase [Alphaproteobacteria bacterium]